MTSNVTNGKLSCVDHSSRKILDFIDVGRHLRARSPSWHFSMGKCFPNIWEFGYASLSNIHIMMWSSSPLPNYKCRTSGNLLELITFNLEENKSKGNKLKVGCKWWIHVGLKRTREQIYDNFIFTLTKLCKSIEFPLKWKVNFMFQNREGGQLSILKLHFLPITVLATNFGSMCKDGASQFVIESGFCLLGWQIEVVPTKPYGGT